MDLSTINTAAELIEANKTPTHTAASMFDDAVEYLTMREAHKLATMLVSQLASCHQSTRYEMVDANNPEASAWAVDEGRYHCALMALNAVDNGDED